MYQYYVHWDGDRFVEMLSILLSKEISRRISEGRLFETEVSDFSRKQNEGTENEYNRRETADKYNVAI